MSYDFPASPSNGQTVTGADGQVYRFDSVKWRADGSTSGVTSFNARSGAVTLQQSDITAVGALNDTGRNLLHNGTFVVAQRGAGSFTANGYTLDRWFISAGGSDTKTITQSAFTDASRAQVGDEAATWALQNVFVGAASAGAVVLLLQYIEDVRRLAGKTATVSFWAVAASGTPKLGLSVDQNFGTGGSPSTSVQGAGQSVTLSTTWTRYSLTFTLPSVSGKTLGTNNDHKTQLNLWYSAEATNATRAGNIGVQSGTISLWGVQLEIGTVATPLAKRENAEELRLCQRFYQSISFAGGSYGAAGSGAYVTVPYTTSMRANAAVTLSGLSYGNASGASLFSQGSAMSVVSVTATATGAVWVAGTASASADL